MLLLRIERQFRIKLTLINLVKNETNVNVR